jgi:hypothetical protein
MRRTVIAAILVATAAFGLAIWSYSDRAAETAATRDLPTPLVHCGGERVDFNAAVAAAPYSVVLPSDTLASADELVGTWDCPDSATRMEFRTGVNVVADVNTIKDPLAAWQGLADTNTLIYSVGEIQGNPALFIDPEADPKDDAEGGITVVLDGVYVSVGGDGTIPLKELVAVAESLEVHSKP